MRYSPPDRLILMPALLNNAPYYCSHVASGIYDMVVLLSCEVDDFWCVIGESRRLLTKDYKEETNFECLEQERLAYCLLENQITHTKRAKITGRMRHSLLS